MNTYVYPAVLYENKDGQHYLSIPDLNLLANGDTAEESFTNGLLEYPQYTRPEVFLNRKVPEVLLSGHHENIRKWREEQSLKITRHNRPDLLKKGV